MRRPWWQSERGQSLVLSVVILAVLLAFAGLVIDGGNFFVQRRNLQGNADAAARAGAASLPDQSAARTVATNYVTDNNAQDDAKVDSISFPEDNTMSVTVRRKVQGGFLGIFGIAPPTIKATAHVELAQMAPSAASGMLPMAFMRESYTLGTNDVVKFDGNQTGNRGAIAPDNTPPGCNASNGAADFRELIIGEDLGGMDACAYEIGETLATEPGNMSGPTRQGFDDRIGSNTQSFEDVFEWDASTERYIILDADSPRIGIVPVIENTDGSIEWPNGRKDVRVTAYVMVYIGKTDEGGYPPYTDGGKNVWVTPIRTILPNEFDGELAQFDPESDAPSSIHLTR